MTISPSSYLKGLGAMRRQPSGGARIGQQGTLFFQTGMFGEKVVRTF